MAECWGRWAGPQVKIYRLLSFSHLRAGVHFGKLIVYFSYANKRDGQIQRDKKRMG